MPPPGGLAENSILVEGQSCSWATSGLPKAVSPWGCHSLSFEHTPVQGCMRTADDHAVAPPPPPKRMLFLRCACGAPVVRGLGTCLIVEYCGFYIVDLKTEAHVTCTEVVVAY